MSRGKETKTATDEPAEGSTGHRISLGDYSAEECNTPEAIRDQLQSTVTALVSRLMEYDEEQVEEPSSTAETDTRTEMDPHQQHKAEDNPDSPFEEEPADVQDEEDDQSSVYTYSNPGLSAATAGLSLTANTATIQTNDVDGWSFLDCADHPSWGGHIDDALSLWMDFCYSSIEHLLTQRQITCLLYTSPSPRD